MEVFYQRIYGRFLLVLGSIVVGSCDNVSRKKLNFPLNGEIMRGGRKYLKLIGFNQIYPEGSMR